MRSDTLNWHDCRGYTEMTALSTTFLFYGQGRIKMHHCALNFIAELFREKGQIKTKHLQQKCIAELFHGHGQTMFIGDRQIRIHYYGTKRLRE